MVKQHPQDDVPFDVKGKASVCDSLVKEGLSVYRYMAIASGCPGG
jgi:hypothetical protein